MCVRTLRKTQGGLVSMTQEFQDDPIGKLIRQIVGNSS
jgi:hypothetical protein